MPAQRGRPKTGAGHRDDAMLAFLDFQGRVEALIRQRQQNYREERDLLTAMLEDLKNAALSWRYGEIVDAQTEAAKQMAAGATA